MYKNETEINYIVTYTFINTKTRMCNNVNKKDLRCFELINTQKFLHNFINTQIKM